EAGIAAADENELNGLFTPTNSAGRPVTYVAPAGDAGFGALWPAISTGAMGVGGTSVAPQAFGYAAQPGSHTDCSGVTTVPGVTSANETVWGNSPAQCTPAACNGTGGGPSAFEPKPTWQSIASGSNRVSPDVAMLADPATGVAMLFNNAWLAGPVG